MSSDSRVYATEVGPVLIGGDCQELGIVCGLGHCDVPFGAGEDEASMVAILGLRLLWRRFPHLEMREI
jgi:hypothetical protein